MPMDSTPSVVSMSHSNGIAGPRVQPAVPRFPPPKMKAPGSTPRGPAAGRGQGKTNLFKRALSNATIASKAAPPIGQDLFGPSGLTTQFAQMNVNGAPKPGGKVYDPSNGPSPSMVTVNTAARSNASGRSIRRKVMTSVCKLSGFTKDDYAIGEIIWVPWHSSNNNPQVPRDDPHMGYNIIGAIFSKRRMVVVLWKYNEVTFCVPIFSHNKTGLQNKPTWLKEEYVVVRNVGDEEFENQGVYPPAEAKCNRKIDKNSVVWVAGGRMVPCEENISRAADLLRMVTTSS